MADTEREAFEAAMRAAGHRADRHDSGEYVGVTSYRREGWLAALASRPAEVDDEGLPPAPTAIPRASNDALNAMAKYWKLDGDWMTCNGCRRSLIASRDGEELAHGDGCKYWDQQHPWAQLRELIARRPAPTGVAQ